MSIPGAFGVPPHDDFKSYMQRAQLPLMVISKARAQSMPGDGEHSHRNKLQVLQGGRRRLEVIEKLSSGPVESNTIRDFLAKSISGLDSAYAADASEPASLPAAGFDVPSLRPGPPRDMNTFARWVEDGPLRTLGYLMRSTVSETQSWLFEQLYEGGINAKLIRVFGWTQEKEGLSASSQADETSLLVFAQPPWILAPADVNSFCECTSLPEDLSAKKRGKHVLWAQIYDSCIARKTHHFVLTNYSNWVFGAFSPGYTRAYVCATSRFDAEDPSIVEILYYWLASGMRIPGTLQLPEVPEVVYTAPITHDVAPDRMHAFNSTTLVAAPAFRETASLAAFDTFSLSSWGCPTESATIIPEQAQMTPTTTFLPELDPDAGLLRNTERFVATHSWTSRIANLPVEPVPEQDDLDKQSSVNSAWSTHSAVTISALNGHPASHWVAPHARGKVIPRAFKAPPEVIPEEV